LGKSAVALFKIVLRCATVSWMVLEYAQFESYLDKVWPFLWAEAQRQGRSLMNSWRKLPYLVVFGLLRDIGRLPADWSCDLRQVLKGKCLAALARFSGVTKRHLYRIRAAHRGQGTVNPTTLLFTKVILAAGVGIPLDPSGEESTNLRPRFPPEMKVLKTSHTRKRRGRPRHPVLLNDPFPLGQRPEVEKWSKKGGMSPSCDSDVSSNSTFPPSDDTPNVTSPPLDSPPKVTPSPSDVTASDRPSNGAPRGGTSRTEVATPAPDGVGSRPRPPLQSVANEHVHSDGQSDHIAPLEHRRDFLPLRLAKVDYSSSGPVESTGVMGGGEFDDVRINWSDLVVDTTGTKDTLLRLERIQRESAELHIGLANQIIDQVDQRFNQLAATITAEAALEPREKRLYDLVIDLAVKLGIKFRSDFLGEGEEL